MTDELKEFRKSRKKVKYQVIGWCNECETYTTDGETSCPADWHEDANGREVINRRLRKRRAWVCQNSETKVAYLDRNEFINHNCESHEKQNKGCGK